MKAKSKQAALQVTRLTNDVETLCSIIARIVVRIAQQQAVQKPAGKGAKS